MKLNLSRQNFNTRATSKLSLTLFNFEFKHYHVTWSILIGYFTTFGEKMQTFCPWCTSNMSWTME